MKRWPAILKPLRAALAVWLLLFGPLAQAGGILDYFATFGRYIVPTPVDLDGTNDLQSRGANLTGVADGKAGLFSIWVRVDGGDGGVRHIMSNAATFRYAITLNSTNNFSMTGLTSAGVQTLRLDSLTTHTAGASWIHVAAAWDLAVAGSGRLYVNGVDQKNEITYNNNAIDYATAANNFYLWVRDPGGGSALKWNGCAAQLYWGTTYLDIGTESNLRKFITAGGKPVNMGADCSNVTGSAPALCVLTGDASGSGNTGGGGAFTTTGSLDACSTKPSD